MHTFLKAYLKGDMPMSILMLYIYSVEPSIKNEIAYVHKWKLLYGF